ncbi:MAG TPA: hypothetical protein VF988_08700 [Verrucomicrobiae bacterium]
MSRPSKNQPPTSNYQKSMRRMTVQLIFVFTLAALGVAALFYIYQRKAILP